jgi:hypothetical protein
VINSVEEGIPLILHDPDAKVLALLENLFLLRYTQYETNLRKNFVLGEFIEDTNESKLSGSMRIGTKGS